MVSVRYIRRGKEPREWDQKLLADNEEMIVSSFRFRLQKPFSSFNGRVLIESGYYGVLFDLWDRWFNVVKIFDEKKRLRGYYSDIRTPPEKKEDGYVAEDLFLDYWVDLDGDYTVLDEDEFEEAELPPELENKVLETSKRLKIMIEDGDYPPDPVENFEIPSEAFEEVDSYSEG